MTAKFLLLTFAASTAVFTASADEADKPAAEVGEYTLKNRSVVHLPIGTRAPFWPIGWVKGAPATTKEAVAEAKPLLDKNSFRVTSILLGSPALAVINGRAYGEGEFVRMPKGAGPAVRVRVQSISDGAVVLQADQQVLKLALQRAELGPKRAEMDYLPDDR